MAHVVVTGAARTPIGAFNGGLSSVPAHELGASAIRSALQRSKIDPTEVDEVVMGQVLPVGAGQNPARRAAVLADIPIDKTAYGVNQVCGSGLRAVALAFHSIAMGDCRIAVAGGQESMSQVPHVAHLRDGTKFGNLSLTDALLIDGLTDAFHGGHMGVHTEALAERFQITRVQQDEFALRSQQNAAAAIVAGRFAEEITPIKVVGRKGETMLAQDEHPRPEITFERLAELKPSFKSDGTITAGNASGLNDGAAALVLMAAGDAEKRGIEPLGRVISWATSGVDPRDFGLGPVPAVRKALEKAKWRLDDLDLIESNEAYAAQSLAVGQELGWDLDKVNVNGGAIALGHPLGASGARVLVTLLSELRRRKAKRGLATLCIGGGMGIALCVERD